MKEGPSATQKFVVQVVLSCVFVIAGLAVLIFHAGGSSAALEKLAAGWIGVVLGFWFQ
jgi:hypothetical protein